MERTPSPDYRLAVKNVIGHQNWDENQKNQVIYNLKPRFCFQVCWKFLFFIYFAVTLLYYQGHDFFPEPKKSIRNYLWFTKHEKANLSFSRRRSYEIRFHLTSLFDRKMYTHIILEYRNSRLSVEQHYRSQFPDGNLTVARECFCMSDLCKFQVERKLIN